MSKDVTRRDILKGVAVGGAALAVGGGLFQAGKSLIGGSPAFAGATPTVLRFASGSSNTANTTRTFSVAAATAKGDSLTLLIATNKLLVTPSSVTDSQGNVYTLHQQQTANSPTHSVFVSQGKNGGPAGAVTAALSTSDTVTVTLNSSSTAIVILQGVAARGVGTLDQVVAATHVASTSTTASVSVTPGSNNEVLLGLICIGAGSSSPAWASPVTDLGAQEDSSGPPWDDTGYQVLSGGSGTAKTLTCNWTGASGATISAVSFAPYPVLNNKYNVNVDYASGAYGAYSSTALNDAAMQAVVVNANWSAVESSRGTRDWATLGNVLAAWSAKGKSVSIVCRFASQMGGSGTSGFLPSWEVTRLNGEYINDADTGFYVPNYWNSNFQSDWHDFVNSLGTYLTSGDGAQYQDAINYVRIGCGLGGEGFYLMDPTGTHFSTYKSQLKTWAGVSTDSAFADAWRSWQEMVLGWYRSAIPAGIPVMYPIVDTTPTSSNWTCSDGNFIDVDVWNWCLGQSGVYGLSQNNLGPDGYGSPGYADIGTLITDLNTNHPGVPIQFQSTDGLSLGQGTTHPYTGIAGTVATLENYSNSTNPVYIEWYEDEAVTSSFYSTFEGYQTWVNSHVS